MTELPEILALRAANEWAYGHTSTVRDPDVRLVQIAGVTRNGEPVFAYAVYERGQDVYAHLSDSFVPTLALETGYFISI